MMHELFTQAWLPALLFPALLLLLCARRWPGLQGWLLVVAAIPALLIAVFAGEFQLELNGVLLGIELGLHERNRALLIMTTLLWTLAGWMARSSLPGDPHRLRYVRLWLLTLTGNLTLLAALDVATFYTFFALMTFAGYGLVVHQGTAAARYAGRIYIILAVVGEAFLLAGFLLGAALVGSGGEVPALTTLSAGLAGEQQGLLIASLLFIGLGVKAGVAGLHWWLPLAHPVAPTPASAVLSGAMIKAGLFGWLMVLPLGENPHTGGAFDPLGVAMVLLGVIAAFAAAMLGVFQRKAKEVLAYSSISQMGLMTVLTGLALLYPMYWEAFVAAILLYAVHHGLAKGALFFGVGWAHHSRGWSRFSVLAVLALPALALIGAPLTSGSAAKTTMKELLYQVDISQLTLAMTWAAVATAALMVRYGWALAREFNPTPGPVATLQTVLAAVVLTLTGVWLVPLAATPGWLTLWSPGTLWDGVWPLGLVLLVVIIIRRRFMAPKVHTHGRYGDQN